MDSENILRTPDHRFVNLPDFPYLPRYSDSDPITQGGDLFFTKLVPAAKEQSAVTIRNAGHILQEEKGEEIARHINSFIDQTSL